MSPTQLVIDSTVVPKDSHRKLHHLWTGPYMIMKKLSNVNYMIAPMADASKTSIVHFDRLKHCFQNAHLPIDDDHPYHPQTSEPRPHHVGDRAELIDIGDPEEIDFLLLHRQSHDTLSERGEHRTGYYPL